MKRLLTNCMVVMGFFAAAQEPVTWRFAVESSGGHYLLKCNAQLKPGWHLYSQTQPKGAIAVPTSFRFNKNPLLSLAGNVVERGKLEKHRDEVLETEAFNTTVSWHFSKSFGRRRKQRRHLAAALPTSFAPMKSACRRKGFRFLLPSNKARTVFLKRKTGRLF